MIKYKTQFPGIKTGTIAAIGRFVDDALVPQSSIMIRVPSYAFSMATIVLNGSTRLHIDQRPGINAYHYYFELMLFGFGFAFQHTQIIKGEENGEKSQES